MDPGFYNDETSYIGGRTLIDLDFLGAAAGAVGAFGNHYAVASVAHGGTGAYLVTFNQSAFKFLGMAQNVVQATYDKTGACKVEITTNSIDVAGTHAISLLVVDAAGDAVDLATGDHVYLTFAVARYPSQ